MNNKYFCEIAPKICNCNYSGVCKNLKMPENSRLEKAQENAVNNMLKKEYAKKRKK